MRRPAVVALGGGHGLFATLGALRHLTDRITAIVTVADDGGSSGRLRRDYDILPPGDLRMALAALCDDSDWGLQWADVLQHRFAGEGEIAGHALGNLLIVALWDLLDDPVAGLDLVARLLNARGRVLPMSLTPLRFEADVSGLDLVDPEAVTVLEGQAAVAKSPGTVRRVRLTPSDAGACPQAIRAIHDADWVVLGPGSWFTSVMPHLLIEEQRRALEETKAKRLVTLNLVADRDEASGYSSADLLRQVGEYAPDLRIDVVLADPSALADGEDDLRNAAASLGARLVFSPVAMPGREGVHDALRLGAAFRDLLR